ncbi:hypothetical protein BDD12DRAFT_827061 [Trichophaea hybrida]|nr:hypothetical protein BDD12DRAFT_827061 [Trichophaea hybrida]
MWHLVRFLAVAGINSWVITTPWVIDTRGEAIHVGNHRTESPPQHVLKFSVFFGLTSHMLNFVSPKDANYFFV